MPPCHCLAAACPSYLLSLDLPCPATHLPRHLPPPLSALQTTRSLPHIASSRIIAVHVDAALAELGALAAFPPLPRVIATRPATLAGAWAAFQPGASCITVPTTPDLSADAEDVAPRMHAAPTATPYRPPASREGATAVILAGCPLAYPAPAQPAQQPAAYVPPHRRTAEQQAAAAEAGRPGRPCPFPYLNTGPLPQPSAEVPWPLYRLALLFPSQRC